MNGIFGAIDLETRVDAPTTTLTMIGAAIETCGGYTLRSGSGYLANGFHLTPRRGPCAMA